MKIPAKKLAAEHDHLVKVFDSPSRKDDRLERNKQAKERDEYKKIAQTEMRNPLNITYASLIEDLTSFNTTKRQQGPKQGKFINFNAKAKNVQQSITSPKSTDSRTMGSSIEGPGSNLAERFFTNAIDTQGGYGGAGRQSGGSPNASGAQRMQIGSGSVPDHSSCPQCGSASMDSLSRSASSCATCGFLSGETTPASSTVKRGGAGIYNPGMVGRFKVPGATMSGGPAQTNDEEQQFNAKLNLTYKGSGIFEMGFDGVKISHSLHNAHTAMNHRLRALGFNQNRVMNELVDWLYLKANPGESYVWDFNNGSRMVNDEKGFKYHVAHSGQG